MIARIRLLVLLARPSVLLLFGLFTATGLAQAGAADDHALLVKALVVVIAFVLFSVVVNDLADHAIDRVNLPGDRSRPLVVGDSSPRQLVVVAAVAGVTALAGSALLHWPACVVVGVGLALSASYSLRPVRIADRGALASLLLPAGYVAVPYLVGILAVRSEITGTDVLLCCGLYVGFIGRILLKDFRDVRGDALFGKRTFLVRHGRRWTCAFSGACWVAGTATLAGIRGVTAVLVAAYVLYVAIALVLLRALSVERGARRDEWLISAIALVGRGMIVTVVAHLGMTDAGWSRLASSAVLVVLAATVVGQAAVMARFGPRTRLTLADLPQPALHPVELVDALTVIAAEVDAVPARIPLDRTERAALAVLLASLTGFGLYGLETGAPSTAAYVLAVSALALVIARFRTVPLPPRLTVALMCLAVAHLAGGLVVVGDEVLYNTDPGTPVLQYDHLVHGSAVFVGTLLLWTLVAAPAGLARGRDVVLLCVLAALGLGALNEVIEFLTTLAHHGAHVGGYTNTGWDLVSNLVGASLAGACIAGRCGVTAAPPRGP